MKLVLSFVTATALLVVLGACGGSGGDAGPDSDGPRSLNASTLMGGDADPDFEDGEAGEISVVEVGPLDPDTGVMILVFRNNTADAVAGVSWTVRASIGQDTEELGIGLFSDPGRVEPGELGLSPITFATGTKFPGKVAYEFEAETTAVDTDAGSIAPLEVTEVSDDGETFVGELVNPHETTTEGPYRVTVYCFDGDTPTHYFSQSARNRDPLDEGETVGFGVLQSATYSDITDCTTFAVGASGVFE